MQVHLGGHLSWYDPQKRSRLEIRLAAPMPLLAFLQQLGIPPAEIAVAAVNGVIASIEDAQVRDEDRLDLLPPVGGGSGGMPVEIREIWPFGPEQGAPLCSTTKEARKLSLQLIVC